MPPSLQHACAYTVSIPNFPLSHCIRVLSILCGWLPSREAHFLILELPELQRVTGSHQPTREQQTWLPRCLQEVDNKPFVFSFYKRKFCGVLPGRSNESEPHTLLPPSFHSVALTYRCSVLSQLRNHTFKTHTRGHARMYFLPLAVPSLMVSMTVNEA